MPGLHNCGAVAKAPASDSESSTTERRSERATPEGNRVGSTAGSQPGDEVSDHIGFVSEFGGFGDVGAKRADLTTIAGVLAGRSLAAILPVLADMRSIAACLAFWGARVVSDCLDSLRPSERAQRELAPSPADAQWSEAAAKLASQSSGASETVRILGAIESRWVHGRRGASGERSASVRSVKLGCCRNNKERHLTLPSPRPRRRGLTQSNRGAKRQINNNSAAIAAYLFLDA